MNFLHISVALVLISTQTVFTRCHKRMANQNAVAAALQNILGPQIRENAMPMSRMPTQWQQDVAAAMPYRAMSREISMPNMRLVEPKCPCQMGGTYPIRTEFINALDNMVGLPMPPMPIYSQPTPEIFTAPIPYPVSSPVQNKPGCGCSCSASAPLVSPFLPSASPVSAWAPPTSNLLPPVIPSQVRSHFLRKIPIPPPTL
ncbi:uncharacterized protein LOC125074318 [Vanessa atalanta]|uniref:uncharacterized protein LOC125074318 n=1 Tax=Vanessa atalanta TaxID=42275 RepID=UPI001FCCEA3A|nr:uncharacterized protein LOC125074318 [Vanessa atalanta]